MKFTFLSLFPSLISGYFGDSILKKAIDSKLIEVEIIDFRAFSTSKHKKVDNYQASGGAGLVICGDVLETALKEIATKESHIIYLTPVAKRFLQCDAIRLAQNYKHIIFICGRYEGIDERIVEAFVDEVFSIGDYILTGGEIASLVLCDCISRQIPQVLGNAESLCGESFEHHLLESPIFTKSINNAKNVANLGIPSEYIKGNHAKINALKYQFSLFKTKYFRPDLYNFHKRIKNAK